MARSSLVWFRISMAARRTSSSWSRISSSAASMTRGPPIFASASAARLRTHQSSSLIVCSRVLTCAGVPISFSTSTAARRAFSSSSRSTPIRCCMVSGSLARTIASIAFCCVSTSGSRRTSQSRPTSTLPSRPVSAFSTACRTNLLVSLSCRCSATPTSRRLKRARMLMMCVRAIGSLPSRRLSSSGTMLASAMSETMRNIAAFSAASWL